MKFNEILTALGLAKTTRADLDQSIAKLQGERAELEQRAAHTDEIVEWLMRSMRAQSQEYQDRLERWYFKPQTIEQRAGTWFEDDASANLLAVPATSPAGDHHIAPTTGINHDIGQVSLLGITHFMMPLIEEQLQAIVAKHFPLASKGIRKADRASKLAAIDKELAKLIEDRDELDAGFKSAVAVLPKPVEEDQLRKIGVIR